MTQTSRFLIFCEAAEISSCNNNITCAYMCMFVMAVTWNIDCSGHLQGQAPATNKDEGSLPHVAPTRQTIHGLCGQIKPYLYMI